MKIQPYDVVHELFGVLCKEEGFPYNREMFMWMLDPRRTSVMLLDYSDPPVRRRVIAWFELADPMLKEKLREKLRFIFNTW